MYTNFDQFLLSLNISPITQKAYKQDIAYFLNLISKKNKNITQIDVYDINEYIENLIKERLSATYAMRKLGVLKLFCKFLHLNHNITNYSYIINNLEIAKFPLFCLKTEIDTLLNKKTNNNFLDLRNKLIIILLYKYQFTITQISTLTFKQLNLTDATIKINKKIKQELIEINPSDIEIFIKYKDYLSQYSYYQNFNGYFFPIIMETSIMPMPIQAIWSTLKKLFTQTLNDHNFSFIPQNIKISELDIETQQINYSKNHPRG